MSDKKSEIPARNAIPAGIVEQNEYEKGEVINRENPERAPQVKNAKVQKSRGVMLILELALRRRMPVIKKPLRTKKRRTPRRPK